MESPSKSHYAAVYADLKVELDSLKREAEKIHEKQDALSNALGFIKERMNGSAGSDEPVGKYSGMVLTAAAVEYLEVVGHLSETRTIADALLEGGYQTTAKNFYNNTYGTLSREVESDNPRVVKEGSKWGLPAWSVEQSTLLPVDKSLTSNDDD